MSEKDVVMKKDFLRKDSVLADLANTVETVWENPALLPFASVKDTLSLSAADIDDAEKRLLRFAPFLAVGFSETERARGIIESPLTEIPKMKRDIEEHFRAQIGRRLFLKRDDLLPIAGSVKARGGIYEVLKHTEDLALQNGILKEDYTVFAEEKTRRFFSRYAVHVGSTGNLGLSIGIMSAAIGYRAVVHMSSDARQWKKDLLRKNGVTVVEYNDDYSKAVEEGRKKAADDPDSYFVDDENSKDLFLGYAVSARRLKEQLDAEGVTVDEDHPLIVTIPCGVGGAPGGIAFGLKHVFGDSVHCLFAEPEQAPCMLLGMATGLHHQICVQDIGLSGRTIADGLAVGRPSGFVGRMMEHLLDGIVTVEDARIMDYTHRLFAAEGIYIEPSACAAFQGPVRLAQMKNLCTGLGEERMKNASCIVWSTGGSLVPEEERQK